MGLLIPDPRRHDEDELREIVPLIMSPRECWEAGNRLAGGPWDDYSKILLDSAATLLDRPVSELDLFFGSGNHA